MPNGRMKMFGPGGGGALGALMGQPTLAELTGGRSAGLMAPRGRGGRGGAMGAGRGAGRGRTGARPAPGRNPLRDIIMSRLGLGGARGAGAGMNRPRFSMRMPNSGGFQARGLQTNVPRVDGGGRSPVFESPDFGSPTMAPGMQTPMGYGGETEMAAPMGRRPIGSADMAGLETAVPRVGPKKRLPSFEAPGFGGPQFAPTM